MDKIKQTEDDSFGGGGNPDTLSEENSCLLVSVLSSGNKIKQTVYDSSGGGGDPDSLAEPCHKDNSCLLVSETGSLRTELENQDYLEGNTSQGNNNAPEPPIDKNLNNSR